MSMFISLQRIFVWSFVHARLFWASLCPCVDSNASFGMIYYRNTATWLVSQLRDRHAPEHTQHDEHVVLAALTPPARHKASIRPAAIRFFGTKSACGTRTCDTVTREKLHTSTNDHHNAQLGRWVPGRPEPAHKAAAWNLCTKHLMRASIHVQLGCRPTTVLYTAQHRGQLAVAYVMGELCFGVAAVGKLAHIKRRTISLSSQDGENLILCVCCLLLLLARDEEDTVAAACACASWCRQTSSVLQNRWSSVLSKASVSPTWHCAVDLLLLLHVHLTPCKKPHTTSTGAV